MVEPATKAGEVESHYSDLKMSQTMHVTNKKANKMVIIITGKYFINISVSGTITFDFWHIHLLNISMMGLPGNTVLEMKSNVFINEYKCLF